MSEHGVRTQAIRSLFALTLAAALFTPAAAQADGPAPPAAKKYRLGAVPADQDTQLGKYLDTTHGVRAQCRALNALLADVCCARHGVGCGVEYLCETPHVAQVDLMTLTAQRYPWSLTGVPTYAVQHASVLDDMLRHFQALQLYGRSHTLLPASYTRFNIHVDDEETKDPSKKIDPENVVFHYLGQVVPGFSDRRGRRIILDYYASSAGILLSTSPTRTTSLALAVAEYRSGLFSLDGKQLTGTGARDLFVVEDGELIPNPKGCRALADAEPAYYKKLLQGERAKER